MGSTGSGNFGHGGRPGERGGSAPGQPGSPEHSRNVAKHFKEAMKNGAQPYHTLTTSEGTVVSDTKKGQLHTDITGKHSWHPDRNIAEDRKAAFSTIRQGQGTVHDEKQHNDLVTRAKEKDGGFSVNLKDNSEPKDGFMVAPSKHTEKIFPAKSFSSADIAQYRTQFSKELSAKDAHLGAWNNGKGSVVLDVSRHFASADEAHAVARSGKQDAIYDVKNGKSIPTQPGSKAFIKRFNSVSGPKFRAAKK